jgi:N-methylhydantoinase B
MRGTRVTTAPWGLFGGHDGGSYRVERDEGVAPFKGSAGLLMQGQSIAIVTPGSGGYGPPQNRDPELVRRDLREERISPEVARDVYGIALED